jgi:hypothetical protein
VKVSEPLDLSLDSRERLRARFDEFHSQKSWSSPDHPRSDVKRRSITWYGKFQSIIDLRIALREAGNIDKREKSSSSAEIHKGCRAILP